MQCWKCGANIEDDEAQPQGIQVNEITTPGVVVRHATVGMCLTCSRLMGAKEHKGDWKFTTVIVGIVTFAAAGIAYLLGEWVLTGP